MPAGIQVFGPDGSEWVGPQDYLGKVVGAVTLNPVQTAPYEQIVTAPNAINLSHPFVVNTSMEPTIVEAYMSVGGTMVKLRTFACTRAEVVPGQNQIKCYGLWGNLPARNTTLWYGSR